MSSGSGSFEKRSPVKVILFGLITFGLYALYWAHQVNKQFESADPSGQSAVVRTVLLIVPVVNLYGFWVFAGSAARHAPSQSQIVYFLTNLVLPPIGWYLVQSGINEVA